MARCPHRRPDALGLRHDPCLTSQSGNAAALTLLKTFTVITEELVEPVTAQAA
jgi:hypothetical protein